MDPELKQKINNLTDKAGVYFFKNAAEQVIYVGKAKNLKKRVKNHFQKPDQHAFDFISQIADIDFIQTGSEKEALLLEQQFIKKLQPRWNTDWKDDKNYFYVALSNDNFPRAHLTHQPNLAGVGNLRNSGSPQARRFSTPASSRSGEVKPHQKAYQKTNTDYFGPFVSGREVKSFLREIRKTLPYRTCRNLPKKQCFYRDLALCLAPCTNMDKKTKSAYPEMMAILRVLLRIYQGQFCMGPTHANAEGIKKNTEVRPLRVECYDVSNLAGTLAVGSMTVFENGKANKNKYRKFKIKTIEGQNDVASLREILSRRLKHGEWPRPDLIILDGGKGQLKAAKDINIPTVALAKIGDKDGKLFTKFSKNYAQLSKLPPNLSNLFLQIRDEAHRFAIIYNKHRRLQIIKTKKA